MMAHVRLQHSDVGFDAGATESILDAGRRAGVVLEHSCRSGRCGVCKTRVLTGESRLLKSESGISQDELSAGWILTCARAAQGDMCLDAEDLGQLAAIQVKTLPCRIASLELMAADVIKVCLRLPPSATFEYLPGQYIDVITPSGRRSYSLAAASHAEGWLELHIRAVLGGELSHYWFEQAKLSDLLRLEGPFGTFFHREKPGRIIFVVTGTGFAPAKAMLEGLAKRSSEGVADRVSLYWGGRYSRDLYYDPRHIGIDLNYVPVLSREGADWGGRRGYVQDAVLHDNHDLSDAVVYCCGSETMIQAARTRFLAAGLPSSSFYSDAFVASN